VQELQESRMRARMKREARKAKKASEKKTQPLSALRPEASSSNLRTSLPKKGSAPSPGKKKNNVCYYDVRKWRIHSRED